MATSNDAPAKGGLRQLRHDLLNCLNVLVGATGALMRSPLDERQRTFVRMLQTSNDRLRRTIETLETYRETPTLDGQQRLADLCSIASARVAKPVDRRRLVDAIESVAGRRPLRILLVDDSPEFIELVRSYLQGTPWVLDVAETGERAVAQGTTERYDLLLMDIDLPGMDGASAAHAIRAADLARGVSPTPVIAMTAFDVADADASAAESSDLPDPEIASLVPEFLANRRSELAMFREALAAGDFARIQAAAHKTKGTGRGYGFAEISRFGAAIELAAHEQDVAALTHLIDALDGYLHHLTMST